MRGNPTRLRANQYAVRALTGSLPPASLGLDRRFWTATALALVFWSLGVSEPALAQVCTFDASGNATCPAGTYTSPINSSANITLLPGVNVVIPAGPGGVNAVNSANTGGVSPGNGGPDITISADGTLGGITINNVNNPNSDNSTGLRIQSGGAAIINATNTAIAVSGGASSWGILAFAMPNANGAPHAASVTWSGSITSTVGVEGGGIQVGNRGVGDAIVVASGNVNVAAGVGVGQSQYGLLAHAGDPTISGVLGAGNASVTYNSGTINMQAIRPRGILAWVDGQGSATATTAAGTVINVSGQIGGPGVYVFSSGMAAAPNELRANVASRITSTGPETLNPSNPPAGIRANNSGTNAPIFVTYTGPGITTVGGNGTGILAQSGSGNITVNSSGPIDSTDGSNAIGISAISATGGGNVTVNVASGASVMGGWQPDLTGSAAGVVLSSGGTATLTNDGTIGALSDRAVQGDPVIINNGTMTGFVTLAGTSSYINNGTFNLRHFADINGDSVRDTVRVAVSDLGGPNSTFANNGTLALLGAPGATTLDSTGQYLPDEGNVFNAMALGGPVQGQVLGAMSFTNSGVIDLQANPVAGDVLVVTGGDTAGVAGGGSFVTNGGSLRLDTVLNSGAPSQSDVLVVDGVAVGAARTGILVRNVGGLGDLTVGDGILVVEGLNNGPTAGVPQAFGLSAPVAAGPYDYLLFRGGTGAGASDDWFLRSSLQPVPPEPPVIPGQPVIPGLPPAAGPIPEPPAPPGPARPRFRQEVSLYAAMPVMASIYGRKIIDTLHERMGGDAQLLRPGKEDMPDGMWGRIIGYWGHRDGDPVGIFGRDGPAFDYDFGAIQTGLDLYRNEYENGQRDNAGLYLAVGRGHADVEHNLLGRTFKGGEDDFDAVSVGGYWTRFGQNNWYLDGVVQGTWYDMEMSGRRGLRDGETNAFGFAASLEGGYPFDLGNDWLLEPQAQLVYQNLNIDDFNDGAADVRYSDTDSLAGRIGARIVRDWDVEGDPKRKFTLWGRADLWHEFLDDPTTEFSSASGFIPFTADLGDTWGKLGIGAARQVSDSTTFYGNVNYETSFDGDADAWEGKVGLKVQW